MARLNRSFEAKVRARELRSSMSLSEQVFWQAIRKDKIGFRFRRQVAVGPYFLDFYCREALLCVEVDGEQHEERRSLDDKRDAFLISQGIETIRIPSLDLYEGGSGLVTQWVNRVELRCWERCGGMSETE